MAFNLSYADKGVDLSDAGSNFKSYAKAAKSKDKETPKEDPKNPKSTTEKPAAPAPDAKPTATGSPINNLIGIINKNGGSPTQAASQNPATKEPTLADVAPGNPLTSTDSLNVNIGLVHNYQENLGRQIMKRSMQDSMDDMDKEAEDKNYLSLDRKNAAAMELRDAMLQAKKNGLGLNSLKLSPMADALHKGFINKAANDAISKNTYKDYLTTGAGLSIK
jgi:hypothetical protein